VSVWRICECTDAMCSSQAMPPGVCYEFRACYTVTASGIFFTGKKAPCLSTIHSLGGELSGTAYQNPWHIHSCRTFRYRGMICSLEGLLP
jgi:hypothetical protein